MKMSYTTPNGRLRFELEAKDGVQAFEIVAKIGLMFEQDECGCCKSKNVEPEVRRPKGFVYYSIKCKDCSASLQLHQHKAEQGGGFYIARSDYPDTNGWGVYDGSQSQSNDQGGYQGDRQSGRGGYGDSKQSTYQPRGGPRPQQDDNEPEKIPF